MSGVDVADSTRNGSHRYNAVYKKDGFENSMGVGDKKTFNDGTSMRVVWSQDDFAPNLDNGQDLRWGGRDTILVCGLNNKDMSVDFLGALPATLRRTKGGPTQFRRAEMMHSKGFGITFDHWNSEVFCEPVNTSQLLEVIYDGIRAEFLDSLGPVSLHRAPEREVWFPNAERPLSGYVFKAIQKRHVSSDGKRSSLTITLTILRNSDAMKQRLAEKHAAWSLEMRERKEEKKRTREEAKRAQLSEDAEKARLFRKRMMDGKAAKREREEEKAAAEKERKAAFTMRMNAAKEAKRNA